MSTYFYTFLILYVYLHVSSASKVYELSDKFSEIRKDGGHWFVLFYAPWCGHCKRMEPVWGHVAQSLAKTNIRVGRIDCTRFTSVANDLGIRGYPTVKFIKGELEYTYEGDRTRQDFVNFAVRLSGPPVREIVSTDELEILNNSDSLYFIYVKHSNHHYEELKPNLWHAYNSIAQVLQPHGYFYSVNHELLDGKYYQNHQLPTVVVHKENAHYKFETIEDDVGELNKTMHQWVNEERFGSFPKITHFNLHEIRRTQKYLVLAVVEENKVNEIPEHQLKFRDMIETVIKKNRDKYHKRFQFGWVGSPDLANSIAMATLPLPYLIVLNTTTHHHHVPDDDPSQMTPEAVKSFLDSIHNQTAPTYGGNHFFVRLYRAYFESKAKLGEMWYGNPVLTTLLFGLPLGFLSLICYSICCPDILDADDEEDDGHEKKE